MRRVEDGWEHTQRPFVENLHLRASPRHKFTIVHFVWAMPRHKCTIARLCPDIAKIFQIHMCAIFFIWISFSTTCSCRNILKEMILRLQINRFLVWSPRWAQINRVLVWYFFTSALRHAAALATPCELYSQSPRELSSRELYSQSLKR